MDFAATKVITNQIQWRGLIHYSPWIMPSALDFLVRTKKINQAFEFVEWHGKGAGTAATRVILKP